MSRGWRCFTWPSAWPLACNDGTAIQDFPAPHSPWLFTVERELEAGNPALIDYANDPGLDVFLTDDPSQVDITEYETGRR